MLSGSDLGCHTLTYSVHMLKVTIPNTQDKIRAIYHPYKFPHITPALTISVKVPLGSSLMPHAQRAVLAEELPRSLTKHICKELEAMGEDPHCANP